MSDIGSLEAELSRQESINRELNYELDTISSGVNSAYSRLENFNGRICSALDNSAQFLNDSEQKMLTSLEVQAEIERLYVRFKAMELANKRIRECNNKKFYDFANYTRVRKLVQGMMDNLDVNMASDRVIYKSIEKEHLKTPDYWLTCVLLSIMGWKNDDKPLADRAMEIAIGLDKKSTCVFYILFNLRMDREEAALKWFMEYQNCELKGADQRTFLLLFALISKSVNSSEELSPKSREQVIQFIHKVVDATITAQGYSREAMVDDISGHLESLVPHDQMDYPLLRKHSSDYDRLNGVMMHARANEKILEFFREILHVQPEQRNLFIKEFIDELIANPNDQEKSVAEEIEYNETIIRFEGDVDQAKEVFGKKKVHDEKELNLIYEMIEWIYGADSDEVNDQSRMNMFVLTKDLQQEAVQKHFDSYRAQDRNHLNVTMTDYTTTMDFTNQAGEEQKITSFYQQKRDEVLQGIKNLPMILGFVIAVACLVGGIAVSPFLFAGTALGAGFGVFKILQNKSIRKQAELTCEENCRLSIQHIASLFEEYQAFEKEFQSYDAFEAEIQAELDQI